MKYFVITVIALGLVGGGYLLFAKNKSANKNTEMTQPADTKVDNNDKKVENPNSSSQLKINAPQIAGNYYQYTKADYQAAKAAHRPIFLFFYANWCPTCAQQEPIVQQLMGEIKDESQLDDLIAFRVNFNDSDTDQDEEALAREFGVTYQHTMFTLDEGGNQVQKLLGQTSKEKLLDAFNTALDA